MTGSSSKQGPSDALRGAIERTFAATARPASGGIDRAEELLNEVVRRGERVRTALTGEMTRRGERVRETLADEVTRRGEQAREAVDGLKARGREDLSRVEDELTSITRRLEELESNLRRRR